MGMTFVVVKKQFEEINVQCWELIANRRFGMKPPFICLKADPAECDVILLLLDELAKLPIPSQRVLTLKQNDRPKSCSRIRFSLSPVNHELTEMSLTVHPPTAEFQFTLAGLIKFRDAVESWKNGSEDFSIRPSKNSKGTKDRQSGEIWFWTLFTDP